MDMKPTDAYAERLADDTIRLTRLLPAAPDRVWAYLTDPTLRRLWLAGGAFDLKPGGAIELRFHNATLTPNDIPAPARHTANDQEIAMTGEIRDCIPGKRLSFGWHMGGGVTTEVEFVLEERGDATLLTVTHARVAGRAMLLSVSGGWHTHLDVLAARLAGQDHPGFWRQIVALEPDYERRFPA